MNFLKGMPIRSQLLILALTIGFITFYMYIITYAQVSNVITDNNHEYVDNILTQVKQSVSQSSGLLGRILTNIAYNESIQKYLFEQNAYTRYEDMKTIDNFLYNIQEMEDGIIDIVILGNGGNSYYLKGMNTVTKNIVEKLSVNTNNYFSGQEQVVYQNVERNCFLLVTPVYSIMSGSGQGNRIGTAAIVFDPKVFSLKVDEKFKSSSTKFYLVDRNNTIYSSNDQALLGKPLADFMGENAGSSAIQSADGNGQDQLSPSGKSDTQTVKIDGDLWIVNTDTLPEIGGKIVSAVPRDKLFENLLWIRKLTIGIFLAAMVACSIPFLIITNNIVDPLKKMMEFMSTIKKDDFNSLKQRIKLKGYVEIETMACEFNKLLDKVTVLTDSLVDANTNLYEARLAKKRSELAYLKSQVNPHFLYNTLETMKGSALEEGAPNTMEMTRALGQIFRYSIKGDDMVKLSEEFNIITSYMKIQQIRFNGRIKVQYEFSEEALHVMIPKMIIQPVVENAVFHGLEAKVGDGSLRIGAEIDEDVVSIWVKDDGVGIDLQKLDEINASLSDTHGKREIDSDNRHMGLFNVNNRIRLAFGEHYGLRLASSPGAGTEVILKIPAIGGD